MAHDSRTVRRTSRLARLASIGLGSSALLLVGCNNAGEGAFGGAALGALSGLAIGSLSGNAGDGAVIGAVSGAVIGGVIGDQNERARGQSDSGSQTTYIYTEHSGRHYHHPPRHRGYHRDPWWDDRCDW